MNIWVAYGALLGGVILWLFLIRSLRTRSWERHGSGDQRRHTHGDVGAVSLPPARIGLWIFLAVITSLFALFFSAYFMRMGHGHGAGHGITDWRSISKPPILWLNTATLILSSVAMQVARRALNSRRRERVSGFLIAGGAFALLFLIGQLVAWQQLHDAGYVMTSGPADAFFYVLTALHGLHVLGGLGVWLRTMIRMQTSGVELIDVRLSIELCTVYWHFLLLVWMVMFALLLST
ncbi:MAG: cytochrome c oxidase subunit 3 [Pseudomonadota bacterium]|nr:cytochrome c oxidase subunit 3 [Pseudomonadota bacterium]